MNTIQLSTENLQRPQAHTANTSSTAPVGHLLPNVSTKRKSKTGSISEEVMSYYQNLLEEHNRFIRKHSTTTYRIL